jgi:nucleoside-diphosphate-sugar epimerase
MPYCPDCGAEYEPGITRCPDCERELVDDSIEVEELDDEIFLDSDVQPVLLYRTNDQISAEVLEEALKDQGIPCLVKAGTGYYSGLGTLTSVFKGISIYIPETALNEAIEIAETVIPDFKLPEE